MSVDRIALFFICNFMKGETMKTDNTKNYHGRLSKKCQQGLDGMNLEYVLNIEGAEHLYLPEESISNTANKIIAKISCKGGKLSAYVNAVHCTKSANLKPLSITETIKLELIRSKVIGFMQDYLKKYLQDMYSDEYVNNLVVKQLECNLTLPCVKGAIPSDVINLFEHALDKTVLHKQRKNKRTHDKIPTSCYYVKPKEYCLKIYDKSQEQREKGNLLVEDNLLRIEMVFIDRSLKRMYRDKRTLSDILTKKSIVILCKEYKRVFEQDLIEKYLKPYLNWCVRTLFDSLLESVEGKEIAETIARCKEHIPDTEVLKKALRRWYQYRNIEDRSDKVIYYYRKKNIGIPERVLRTVKMFHTSC